MTDINTIVLCGNLTRDLDEHSFGYTNTGMARANISVAVNRSYKKGDDWQNEVSYFDIVVWGKLAENLKPYFKKGQKIVVSGFLKQDRWEKDGKKNSKVYIVADSIQLVGPKGEVNSQGQNNFSDDDIPFGN